FGGYSDAKMRSASSAAFRSAASARPERTASVAFMKPSYTAANVAASIERPALEPSALRAPSFPRDDSMRHVPWFHGAAASVSEMLHAPSGAPAEDGGAA